MELNPDPGSLTNADRIRILVRLESPQQWNSTSVLLNKLPTSQEVNDLLVLKEFPLLLWVIFCPPGSGSACIRIQSRSGFETVKFNLSLVEQASDVAVSQWPPCSRGVPASFVGYFCLSWIRIRMNPDPIRTRNSEILPQSCWTSFRRRRKSMTSLFSRSSRFFSLRISSRMEVFTNSGPIRIISSGRGGGGAASKLEKRPRSANFLYLKGLSREIDLAFDDMYS